MHAQRLQARLRTDLRSAMRDRKSKDVSVLRSLIAAIDNAQAISVDGTHDRYVRLQFSDASAEVQRRQLSGDDLKELLNSEIEARKAASIEYDRAGRRDRAVDMSSEADILSRYLDSSGAP